MSTYPGDATFDSHESDPNSSKSLKKPHLTFKKMCANIALDFYNDENGTIFKLVEDETLDSYAFADYSASWIHCSFNAKDDSSINNFFAELQYILSYGAFRHHLHDFNTRSDLNILINVLCPTTLDNLYTYSLGNKCSNLGCFVLMFPGDTQVGCVYCKSITHPIVGYRGSSLGNVNHVSYKMPDDYEEYSPATTIGYPVTTDSFVPVPPSYYPRTPGLGLDAGFEKLRIRRTIYANRALDHYNKTNGTKFALINDDYTRSSPFSETWIHISFNAIDSSGVKLFFAEIKYDKVSGPAVTVCKILEGETKDGCENCHSRAVTHPVVGYRGDFHVETEIDEKDKDSCYKVYCEEFLGEEVTSHS